MKHIGHTSPMFLGYINMLRFNIMAYGTCRSHIIIINIIILSVKTNNSKNRGYKSDRIFFLFLILRGSLKVNTFFDFFDILTFFDIFWVQGQFLMLIPKKVSKKYLDAY